jgi:plastocyanin
VCRAPERGRNEDDVKRKGHDASRVERREFLRCLVSVGAGGVLGLASEKLRARPIVRTAEESQSAGSAVNIVIDNFSFSPATATVAPGTTVTWTNRDDIPHTVVSIEQKFKSPVLDTDEKFSHKFDTVGSYKYFCSIHPKMTGEIVVK